MPLFEFGDRPKQSWKTRNNQGRSGQRRDTSYKGCLMIPIIGAGIVLGVSSAVYYYFA